MIGKSGAMIKFLLVLDFIIKPYNKMEINNFILILGTYVQNHFGATWSV